MPYADEVIAFNDDKSNDTHNAEDEEHEVKEDNTTDAVPFPSVAAVRDLAGEVVFNTSIIECHYEPIVSQLLARQTTFPVTSRPYCRKPTRSSFVLQHPDPENQQSTQYDW